MFMNFKIYIVSEDVQNICISFQHICSINTSMFTQCQGMFPALIKIVL